MDFIQTLTPSFLNIVFFSFKAFVIVSSVLICIIVPVLVIRRSNPQDKNKKHLKLENIKTEQQDYIKQFNEKVMNKKHFKKYINSISKESEKDKPSLFVLAFTGDILASQVKNLRDEISLILNIAKRKKDEVAILLESRGGSVSHYGLAANQLQRLRDNNIYLTVCVDQVAGSGGYLMACVGNQILSSPFAFIGSIGVMYAMPNLYHFLKKHNISYEEFTAGKFKRTVTPFGEITKQKTDQLQNQLDLIHSQFKNFIKKYRNIDLNITATGEAWLAEEALKKDLVDKLQCSDDYISEKLKTHNVYKLSLKTPKKLLDTILNKKTLENSKWDAIFSKDFII